jgi:hypothetical protein
MTRKTAFWILLTVLCLASAAFSWRYFTRAFPLLSVDIRMDRQGALAEARRLAADQQLGPPDFSSAASFSLDDTVQTFVELEGGGKPAFSALVADRLFTPYRWRVRHFKEREPREAAFSFAPDGTADGFDEKLKEDAPGAALEEAAARRIAESTARRVWHVDLEPFQAVEHSQEQRIGGRVDHTFVYERPDRQLGEGRYRLSLVVAGDKLTGVTYFIKIPDAFTRRYDHMRSANTAIGVGGALAMLVVYGIGGIAVGLFFLTRERWVIWRQPVMWGSIVALAQTAAAINEWPLAWMQYDTALSTRAFVAQQVSAALAGLAGNVVLFSLSFMAAESLTRRAFPHHPQFWRLWGRDAANSRPVLGRTVAGYLLVPLFVAYEVGLYLFATKYLGWWTPSEALFNPDVLATYMPWFSAIAKSFQAGFWEESLFRAVPIAGAALIGDRFGNRRLWIIAAFIVQAVIFGAGHAPYPTQPAYARPVELALPSIGFGLLYLVFGLLPGIILHFTFDAFWFAMPFFASSAAGIRVQQIMVVAAMFVPLMIVLARRAAAGRWVDLAAQDLNAAWRPESRTAETAGTADTADTAYGDVTARAVPSRAALTPSRVRAIAIAGAIGAAAYAALVMLLPVRHHSLRASRTDAAAAARTALAAARLGSSWRFLPVPDEGGGMAEQFVWKTAGRSMCDSLLGTYLPLAGWTVFVRTFEGDVAERAESWTVHLDRDAGVQRVAHELPESRRGPALDRAAAEDLARRALIARFGIDPSLLREMSAVPAKLPERTDWTITYVDSSRPLPQGEARLSVRLAGDEIADARRFVYVPEDWQRTERNARTVASIVQAAGGVLGGILVLGGVIAAIVSWSGRRFVVPLFLKVFVALLVLSGIRVANSFPEMMASLSTSQPIRLQLAIFVGSSVVGLGVLSAAMALITGAMPVWSRSGGRLPARTALAIGAALGALAAAARAGSALMGSGGPMWPSYEGAGTFVPFVAAATVPTVTALTRIVVLLVVVAAANHVTGHWTRRRVSGAVLVGIAGSLLGGTGASQNMLPLIASAAVVGALLAVVYVSVLRHDVSVVPFAVAAMTAAGTLREGWLRAYPGALGGAIAAVVAMCVVAYWLYRALNAPRALNAVETAQASPARPTSFARADKA